MCIRDRILTSLIQYPKLATNNAFDLIKEHPKFLFLEDIRSIYISNEDIHSSIIIEKIENEKVRNIFGEALVSEIALSEEDATIMLEDCINFISQFQTEREDVLKQKYSVDGLNSAEKRELQQLILKKDKMSQDEANLLKNLSSK